MDGFGPSADNDTFLERCMASERYMATVGMGSNFDAMKSYKGKYKHIMAEAIVLYDVGAFNYMPKSKYILCKFQCQGKESGWWIYRDESMDGK